MVSKALSKIIIGCCEKNLKHFDKEPRMKMQLHFIHETVLRSEHDEDLILYQLLPHGGITFEYDTNHLFLNDATYVCWSRHFIFCC